VTIIELEAHRRTVTTPQGPVRCIDVGNGSVALFVHGVGTNALLWHPVIRAFAGERRCVAIDLPLHGRTPAAPGQDFSLGALADVVERLLTSPLLPPQMGVSGHVYDVETGRVTTVVDARYP